MASARYTLNIKPEDLKPDEPRQLTRKEKLANWWYYHRLHAGIGAAVLAILIWLAADMLNRTLPDYQIALVTEQYIPETVVTELGDALSAFGLDLNGDGQALVQVSGYQLSLGGEEETGASASSSSTVTTTVEHDLTGAESGSERTLEGTVVTAVKTAADGETETVTTTLTPAMKLISAQDGEILAGTVALEEMTGKNVTKALTFTFDEEPVQAAQPEESGDETDSAGEGVEPEYDPMPQSSLSQNEAPVDGADSDFLVGQPPIGYQVYEVPETMQTYDLDAAQADQLEALRGELYQNLAGRLLAALAKLPAEDAALLADNMSEEDYAAFLELVDP